MIMRPGIHPIPRTVDVFLSWLRAMNMESSLPTITRNHGHETSYTLVKDTGEILSA